MKFLRIFGIGVGVVALGAIGIWQLSEEGEFVPRDAAEVREELQAGSSPSKEERQIAGLKTITAYCQYGSVSREQMEGCYFNVHLDEIEDRDTNAAKWARDELGQCLSDAGPFCGIEYREELERRIDQKVGALDELRELEDKYGSD